METLLKCIVLFLCISSFDATRHKEGDPMFRCDYKYFTKANGWLNLHRIPDTWEGARLQCQLEGAVLASPLTKGLGTAMKTLRKNFINTTMYKSHNYSERIPNSIYTGFHATYSKKVFTSVEGVPLAHTTGHTRWAWGSPYSDVVGDADALVMGPELGLFGVNGKKEEYPFICYKNYEKKPINPCSGTFDDQYFLYEKTGSCYKFHNNVPKTWPQAFMTCAAEGGHLVVINSDDEANYIKDLLNKKLKRSKHRATYENELRQGDEWVHVGFKFFKRQPITIHGQLIEEAGYSNLDASGPAPYICGAITNKGILRYTDCPTLRNFICEKKPGRSHCKIN